MPTPDDYQRYLDEFDDPGWDSDFTPVGRQSPCCRPPIVRYQGDVIEAAFDSEPIEEGATSLLSTTYKSPDYTGHVYGMGSKWTGLQLRAVDEELGRLGVDARRTLSRRVRVDRDRRPRTVPAAGLGGRRAARPDPARALRRVTVLGRDRRGRERRTLGGLPERRPAPRQRRRHDRGRRSLARRLPIPAEHRRLRAAHAVEQDLLDQKEFAAVFGTTFLESLADRDLARYGDTVYADGDPDGIPGLI